MSRSAPKRQRIKDCAIELIGKHQGIKRAHLTPLVAKQAEASEVYTSFVIGKMAGVTVKGSHKKQKLFIPVEKKQGWLASVIDRLIEPIRFWGKP